jgi:nicotinamide-nucleotide amidase
MIDEDLASHVANALGGRTIATAESCTAGRITSTLAAVERATNFVRGGVIAYHDEAKRELLGVTASSVLSEPAAAQMATGACRVFGAEVAVSTTGVVGPEPLEGVAPGTVFIGTCVDGETSTNEYRFDGTPEQICDTARHRALADVLAHLERRS